MAACPAAPASSCHSAGCSSARWSGGARAERRAISADLARPRELHGAAYAGSGACRSCHEDRHASWQRTFHPDDDRRGDARQCAGRLRGRDAAAGGRHPPDGSRRARRFPDDVHLTGAPPRTVEVVRTVGSRRYQQYLARVDDSDWRLPVAWNVEEKRWFPMTGAFLFSDPSGAPVEEVAGRPSSVAATSIATSRAGTTTASSATTWRRIRGAIPPAGGSPPRSPSSGSLARPATGPGAEHVAVNGNPAPPLGAPRRRDGRSDDREPARLTPARSADLCGRCHGQRIADSDRAAHRPWRIRSSRATIWRWRARRSGATPPFAAIGRRSRRASGTDGTPRLTAYEYQGLLQSPVHDARADDLQQLPRHARRRSARGRSARASAARRRTPCAPAATRRWRRPRPPALSRAPRSGGGGGRRPLRLLPHRRASSYARARPAPQPPDRDPRAGRGPRPRVAPTPAPGATSSGPSPGPRRPRDVFWGEARYSPRAATRSQARRRSRRCSAARRWRGRSPPTRSAGPPVPTPPHGRARVGALLEVMAADHFPGHPAPCLAQRAPPRRPPNSPPNTTPLRRSGRASRGRGPPAGVAGHG